MERTLHCPWCGHGNKVGGVCEVCHKIHEVKPGALGACTRCGKPSVISADGEKLLKVETRGLESLPQEIQHAIMAAIAHMTQEEAAERGVEGVMIVVADPVREEIKAPRGILPVILPKFIH